MFMNPYELVDLLCGITSLQSDIIRKQQAVIAQHGIEVEDAEIDRMIEQTEKTMDRAETYLRRV